MLIIEIDLFTQYVSMYTASCIMNTVGTLQFDKHSDVTLTNTRHEIFQW